MRYLHQVIDKITDVAPDLEKPLRGIRTSALYAAPEFMWHWWQEAASILILSDLVDGHPKREQIRAIFGGND